MKPCIAQQIELRAPLAPRLEALPMSERGWTEQRLNIERHGAA